METPFAVLLVLCAFYLTIKNNLTGAILAGVLPFIRAELIFITPFILSVYYFQFHRRLPILILLIALGAAPFVTLSWHWFGTVIPHTTQAKSLVYQMDTPEQLVNLLLPDLNLNDQRILNIFTGLFLTSLFIGNFLSLLTLKKNTLEKSLSYGSLLYCLLITLSYQFSGVYIQEWYRPLVLFPFALNGIYGLYNYNVGIKIPLIGFIFFVPFYSLCTRLQANWAGKNCFEKRVDAYYQLGKELKSKSQGKSILSAEIGAVGYGFEGYIYDAVGLTSPQALKYHPLEVPQERSSHALGSIPPKYALATQADFIVTFKRFGEALLRDKDIAALYKTNIINTACSEYDKDRDLENLYLLSRQLDHENN